MKFPIDLTFKLLALASQIYVRDADGLLLGYVKQKMFKLKEDINIFADEGQTRLLFNIKADRVLDFSANYRFTDAAGNAVGAIKRKGMRSIWRAHYLIFDAAGNEVMNVHEENGWIKFVDAFVGELPIIGIFTGYLFNPAYLVARSDGTTVARLQKQPAFFEGKFRLTQLVPMPAEEETRVLLAMLTMTLLERRRG